MSFRFLLVLTASAGVAAAALSAQTPDQPVFRVSVTSVQIDAVVTDASGRRVTDLTADDFEIIQDGRARPIRTFRYEPSALPVAPTPTTSPLSAGPLFETTRLQRDHVHRAIAIVVDDLGLSFVSVAKSRAAVQRFVETALQPGDIATIVRTSAGVGMLQQFTGSKALLKEAANGIRYSSTSRYAADWVSTLADENADIRESREYRTVGRYDRQTGLEQLRDFRASTLAVGTLGAVNFVASGMRDLPGRKALVLITDGFTLFDRANPDARVISTMRRLVESANRSSVVIYTIDAKGLVNLAAGADVAHAGDTPKVLDLLDSQDGPMSLADATGGFGLRNINNLEGSLARVLDDQLGYYLIGFETDTEPGVAASPRFRSLKVRVKRPGLRVRARSGYFGLTDLDYEKATNMRTRMARALASPFGDQRIALKMTPVFRLDAKGKPVVRALTHLDATGLTFTPRPEGGYGAKFQIVGVTVDENGAVVSQSAQTYTLNAKTEPTPQERRNGFVYALDVPVRAAGPYMFRVAVADAASDVIGSAQQFVVVPDTDKRRLALSGIVIQEATPDTAADGPAVRRFSAPADLDLAFDVYHPAEGAALESQIRLFQEEKPVVTLASEPIPQTRVANKDALRVLRGLRLSPAMPPGDYQVQVLVTERRPRRPPRTVTQWADFSVRQPAQSSSR